LKQVVARCLSFALPPRCPGCGAITPNDHAFCLHCWTALAFLGQPQCARCGEPFDLDRGADALCGACIADPPPTDAVNAAVAYGPIARALALKLKYGRRPGIARTIGAQMRRHLPQEGEWYLVPVPLHRWRIWSRGYNQSALLARALLPRDNCHILLDALVRTKSTPQLRGLGRARRAKEVRGAFRVADKSRVEGRSILLIDDVYTTGATVNACAMALKRAGASQVRVLCWARVVRDLTKSEPELEH